MVDSDAFVNKFSQYMNLYFPLGQIDKHYYLYKLYSFINVFYR